MLQGKAMTDKLHNISGQIHRLRDRMLGDLDGVVSSLEGPIAHSDMSQGYLSFETASFIRATPVPRSRLGSRCDTSGPRSS